MTSAPQSPTRLFGFMKRETTMGSESTLAEPASPGGIFPSQRKVAPAPSTQSLFAPEKFAESLGIKTSIERKLICTGNAGAGKTSMLTVFMTGDFEDKYLPTIFETTNTEVDIDGRKIKLGLWDTAGQEEYARLRALCYSNANVILCCYAIDDRNSFREIEHKWIPEARHFCPNVPIVLVGTKHDLRENQREDGESADGTSFASASINEVAYDEAVELKNKLGLSAYIECSARTHHNIRDVFERALRATLVEAPEMAAPNTVQDKKKAPKKKRECKIL